MGAEQSSSRQAGGASDGGAVRKTCYYEVLGLERQASEDDIKKAYRRKALELHPDRNYGNVENATTQFAEVQSAYQILSDPQERAWYDSHRETILRGEDADEKDHYEHNVKVTSAGDLMILIGKFSPNIPFTDAPNGFFGSLAYTFETLSREEDAACDWEGLDPIDWPDFGKADDDYDDVVKPFYTMWSGFATRKTFAWKDLYNYAEAPDRRVRRLMEKENKRLREDAIREFNDTVRSLVSFVRKRDPRYVPNTQTEADRQKILRDAATAQAARSRAAYEAKINEQVIPEWARNTIHEAQTGDFSDSEESVQDHYECVVCNKTFKSEKQYGAHEKSKKHIKAVQQLKRDMQRENRHLNLDGNGNGIAVQDPNQIQDDEPAGVEQDDMDFDNSFEEMSESGVAQLPAEAEVKASVADDAIQVEELSSGSELDDEYAPRAKVETRLDPSVDLENSLKTLVDATGTTSLAESASDYDSSRPKLGKAKAKRAKKAARQESSDQSHRCGVCNEDFPSKTKLFSHIKEEDHATPVSVAPVPSSGGKKKKVKKQ